MRLKSLQFFVIALHLILLLVSMQFNPVSWDEGWNFCVAKTWLQQNHYGCMLLDRLTDARLSTGWISVFFSKLGFQIFGIGYVQGRIFFVLVSALALFAIRTLSARLFGEKVALATLVVLLLFSGDQRFNFSMVGSQGWGEVPMVFFIISGFLILTTEATNLRSSLALGALSAVCFALASHAKLQAQPFLSLAILTGTVIAFREKFRFTGISFATALVVSWGLFLFVPTPLPFQDNVDLSGAGVVGLKKIAFILEPAVRLRAVSFALSACWLLYLCVISLPFMDSKNMRLALKLEGRDPLIPHKYALWMYCLSLMLWFLAFSIDFPRYLSPALFVGSLFVGLFFCSITNDFTLQSGTGKFEAISYWRKGWVSKGVVVALSAILFLQIFKSASSIISYLRHFKDSNQELVNAVDYINKNSEKGSVVETYDSQTFFLLDRPFHYPPDQLHLDWINAAVLNGKQAMPYDMLQSNPEYLILGEWSRVIFPIYDDKIVSEKFDQIAVYGAFQIFKRKVST